MLVLLVVVLCAAYVVSQGLGRLRSKLGELLDVPTQRQQPGEKQLVACATCGVHIPRSRALQAPSSIGGTADSSRSSPLFYCSESCRRPAQPVPLRSHSGAA